MSPLSGYTLEAAIGSGSTGTVYRARQHASGDRLVAVKRVAEPALAAALAAEGELLASLDHPAIVRVFELVPDGDGVAVVMQYAGGGSLEHLLAARGRLPPGQAVAMLAPLAEALASAHGRGVVHRDVKPSNVLFTSEGHPMLADFGLAAADPQRPAGSATYLDPTLLYGRRPDARSDIYALGVVAWETLAGEPPFGGATSDAVLAAADEGHRLPLVEAAPGTSSRLAAAVERAVARDPDVRYADAEQLAHDLRAAAGEPLLEPPGAPAADDPRSTRTFGPEPPRPEPDAAQERRIPWPVVVAAALVLLAAPIALAVLVVRGGPDDTADDDREILRVEPDRAAAAPAPHCDEQPGGVLGVGDVGYARIEAGACPVEVRRTDRSLLLVAGDDEPVEIELARSDADSVVVLGDFSCTGIDTPAIYWPRDGQVFVAERWPDPAQPELRLGGARGAANGTPEVLVDRNGCAELRIVPPDLGA